MSVKPLSPDEVRQTGLNNIPSEVIEAVNELLSARWRGKGSVIIKQKEIIELASDKMFATKRVHARNDFFDGGWLDFEPLFESVGWKVSYDKPAYCETYDAFFEFEKK